MKYTAKNTMRKILHFLLQAPEVLFLVGVGFLTRFWNLGFPNSVVFDEAHFGLYATKYLSHQYYFDIHPPLGKMILAFFAWLARAKPGFDFAPGASYGDFPYFWLRFAPALFGVFLIILVYFFVKTLGFSRRSAFLASFFVLFDNAILVQSRLILLDIFLLFFIFLSLLLFWLFTKTQEFSLRWWLLGIACGLALGAASSIKLIGAGALLVVWFWQLFNNHFFKKTKKDILFRILLLFILPILLYVFIFSIHVLLLPNPCSANCGEVLSKTHWLSPAMIQRFNVPLGRNFLEKLYNDTTLLFGQNVGVTRMSYYYQSVWYTWPFMIRPILFYTLQTGFKVLYLYFLGNPFVWWFSFLGVVGVLYVIFRSFFYRSLEKIPSLVKSSSMQFLLVGFLIFWFSFASIQRFLLLYHYLTALIFAVIIFSVFVDAFLLKLPTEKANIVYGAISLLVFLSFLYFAPLTYGIPLTDAQFHARMWLPTWNY